MSSRPSDYPPPVSADEFVGTPESPEDERLEVGVLFVGGGPAGLAGAIRLAKELGPGRTIVTVLCDSGTRYQSKLFNPEFLRSKKLPVPGPSAPS